jgi:hypothetical protein
MRTDRFGIGVTARRSMGTDGLGMRDRIDRALGGGALCPTAATATPLHAAARNTAHASAVRGPADVSTSYQA